MSSCRPPAAPAGTGRWRAGAVAAAALLLACRASAADAAGAPARPAQLRLGVERLDLPGGERMGLFGTTYLVDIAPGLAAGPAAYAAVSGRRGGFYTVGGELLWSHTLARRLGLDLGMYVGGGGGGDAPQGSGLMLRPHADLWWDLGAHAAGLSWSRVRFPDGRIDSSQIGVAWRWRTGFRPLPSDAPDGTSSPGRRSGAGIDRVQALAGVYRPTDDSRRLGAPIGGTLRTVGFRAERVLGHGVFGGIETHAATGHGVAGYAELLATIGTETALAADRLRVGGRLALGTGGGGGIDVGGGLLTKASLHANWRIADTLGIGVEVGRLRSPQGRFAATHVGAALDWTLERPEAPAGTQPTARNAFRAGLARYDALRRDGTTRPLGVVTLALDRFVAPQTYVGAQVQSALAGSAGGYSVGLLGVGMRWPLAGGWHAGAELLGGAAGGGAVDSGGGLVVQPTVFVEAPLGRDLALRLEAGRIRSRSGTLDDTVVGAALSYAWRSGSAAAPTR